MIDEPELNLHPKNQRLMARLFARLANIGINVFITTHSDYIIKELNTLIMLNQDLPHVEKIIAKEGYQKDELIDIKDIRVYNAREDLIKASGSKRKVRGNTLVPADIDQQTGIGIDSFDDSINEMNEIQSEILFGG
jgi:ABC-type multidrug transport system ATPase subunit